MQLFQIRCIPKNCPAVKSLGITGAEVSSSRMPGCRPTDRALGNQEDKPIVKVNFTALIGGHLRYMVLSRGS